jgi:hypothetical protein
VSDLSQTGITWYDIQAEVAEIRRALEGALEDARAEITGDVANPRSIPNAAVLAAYRVLHQSASRTANVVGNLEVQVSLTAPPGRTVDEALRDLETLGHDWFDFLCYSSRGWRVGTRKNVAPWPGSNASEAEMAEWRRLTEDATDEGPTLVAALDARIAAIRALRGQDAEMDAWMTEMLSGPDPDDPIEAFIDPEPQRAPGVPDEDEDALEREEQARVKAASEEGE